MTTPWDVALMLFLTTYAVIETLTVTEAPMPAVRAMLAAATMFGLAFRRKLPLIASGMVAFGVVAESVLEPADELAVLLGVIIAAFSVAAYAPRREALIGASLLSMAIAAAISVDPSDSAANICPTLMLFVVIPVGLGMTLHRRQQEVAVLQLETEALAREADAAVDVERRRIARELHDVVSHAVTLIAVQAEAGQAVIDRDPEAARRSLTAIGAVSREALAELGRLLTLLRDEESSEQAESGMDRLPALVEGARAAGLTVAVDEEGVRRPLPPAADHCAYRVVQEGLTNALRHASGAKVSVLVRYDEAWISLQIDTTGKRHSSAYGGTGRGLAGLRERVLSLGGTPTRHLQATSAFARHFPRSPCERWRPRDPDRGRRRRGAGQRGARRDRRKSA